jgi:hypothetical protein
MMAPPRGPGDYGRFDELAEEFAGRYRRGERPGLQEYVDRLPEMAGEIRGLFATVVEVEEAEGVARATGGRRRRRRPGASAGSGGTINGPDGDGREGSAAPLAEVPAPSRPAVRAFSRS